MDKVLYALQYCSCIYESGWETISLHHTKEGVAKAMNQLKSEHFHGDDSFLCLNPDDWKSWKDEWDVDHIGNRRIERLDENPQVAYRYRKVEVKP